MCMKKHIIYAETLFGRSFSCCCSSCDAVHLEFGNFALNMKPKEFYQFKNIVDNIDEEYCRRYFTRSPWRRKIQIQIKPTLTMLALTSKELSELRALLQATLEAMENPLALAQVRATVPNIRTNKRNAQEFRPLAELVGELATAWRVN